MAIAILSILASFLISGCAAQQGSIDAYICAVDDCASIIAGEVSRASSSVYFLTYEFTDKQIADTIIERSKRIEVKGVIERQRISQQYNKFSYLKEGGVEVVPDRNNATMHHKVFIIDEYTVITGSFNPTKSASERNDENIVIIRDSAVAAKFLQEFWRVFG